MLDHHHLVPDQYGFEDMILLPEEVPVFLLGGPAFPAIINPDDSGHLRPRFRPAIARRILEWFDKLDDGDFPIRADWDEEGGIDYSVVRNSGRREHDSVTLDADDRYEFGPEWPWAVPTTPPRFVFDDILALASEFTLDINPVPPATPEWNDQLVLYVAQRAPDEWIVRNASSLVLRWSGPSWVPAEEVPVTGPVSADFYGGRDAAFLQALHILEKRRDESVPEQACRRLTLRAYPAHRRLPSHP